jgi:hypothetical protein
MSVAVELTVWRVSNLVELQGIEKLIKFAILLGFLKLDIVLLESMKGELRLVIDKDLERLKIVRRPFKLVSRK